MRRNLYIPAETWASLNRLAAAEGAKQGRPVSISEWIRLAVRRAAKRLDRSEANG